ncbi:MAG TPA: septum formation initiator family protein [Gaiellaceae bacterium]
MVAVGALLAIALAYVRPLQAYFAAKDEVAARRAEVAALEREQAKLERRLAISGTDAFVVQEARKLGLVRPGEQLFIVKGLREARLR